MLKVKPGPKVLPQTLRPDLIAPCRLRRLDIRYRTKYHMSMLENLEFIRDSGIDAFIESERDRWTCPECGGMQCVHTDACVYCGHQWG